MKNSLIFTKIHFEAHRTVSLKEKNEKKTSIFVISNLNEKTKRFRKMNVRENKMLLQTKIT